MRKQALIGTGAATAALAAAGVAAAQILTGVPAANPAAGSPANVLAAGFSETQLVTGNDPLENPVGVYKTYGYLDDNASAALRTRTEADQNTYLNTAENPGGPTADYDYGNHFLLQGHENGGNKAYLTRINLDITDPDHRITLLSTALNGAGETGLDRIDGAVYNPFSNTMLYTAEGGTSGFVVSQPLKWSSTTAPTITRLDGSMGRGGYEGVVPDDQGNIYLVDDSGGAAVVDNGVTTKVKQPNSFVYRFKPTKRGDLTAGKLQALQVTSGGTPITFGTDAAGARDDALGAQIADLHSGATLTGAWVTVHDTAVDGTASFVAGTAAKAANATPMKRPENGKFVPATGFKSYIFTETGDTDKTAGDYPGAAARGAWGALVRVDMPTSGSDTATVKTVVLGDQTHAAFDNVTFLDKDTIIAGEDRGETLHTQANALDSLWSFDLTQPFATITANGKRLLAQGRDADAAAANISNETTGMQVSNGATSQADLQGTVDPAKQTGVRFFYTQQHGFNRTFEITSPATPLPVGEKGPAGDKGVAGDKGLAGDKGSPGDKGVVGDGGPKGPVGDKGPAGPTGTFTIKIVIGGSGKASAVKTQVPSAGRITAELSRRAGSAKTVLATGSDTFTQATTATLKLKKSTSKSAKALRGRKVKATLKVKFIPTGKTVPVIQTSTVTIKV